jgi:serine/threonine protein kinase
MDQSVLATASSEPAHFLAHSGKLQGRYLVVRQLGAGGMGAVYEAVDERLQVTVAIKETFAVDARLRWQFEQEARLLAQLSHPALPRVSDYFTEDGRAFLVMQFIGGDDLAQIIAQQPGPFPRAQVIAWADQLLDALIYLHTRERQIIHRDIKPHNLKLTANGQIALLDFGLAKAHVADQTTTLSSHSIFGYTRRYSPLEQIQDQGTSPQSDLYALGATLYHLLTGIRPTDALARAAALANSKPDPLIPAHEIHPLIEKELSALIQKALALNLIDRFQSATEFREGLRMIGRSEPCPPVAPPERAAPRVTSSFDPFDSYAILKPTEHEWSSPRRSWLLGLALASAAIIAVAITAAFPVWFGDQSVKAVVDSARPAAAKGNNAALPHETNSERVRSSSSASISPVMEKDRSRAMAKQKRPNRRAPNSPVDPPAPSLRYALRVPAQ